MGVRIVLADDHNVVRQGLRELFERESDMTIVGEAEDGQAALRVVREVQPDVIIMDVSMPNLNGVDATRQIHDELPRAKVVALSVHSHPQFVSEMLKAGAKGYLYKSCTFAELLQAVQTVAGGQTYLSPGIAGGLVEDYVQRFSGRPEPGRSNLTAREREILQLLAEGKSAKEIALQLHLGVKTVEGYRRQIMDKLNAHSVAALTKYAVLQGLTSLDG